MRITHSVTVAATSILSSALKRPDRVRVKAFRTQFVGWLTPIALALAVPNVHAEVDPLGHFTHEIGVDVPAFRGLAPKITLRYSSGSGNGFVGVGWSLDVGATIARVSATHGVPCGDASDRFLLDGEELIPCATGSTSPSCTTAVKAFGSSNGFFSTRIENFKRIKRHPGNDEWTIWERDGTQLTLRAADGLVTGSRTKTYRLRTVSDTHGNAVRYVDWFDGRQFDERARYPDEITYAGQGAAPGASIRFIRELRPDKVEGPGSRFSFRYRLARIEVHMHGHMARAYELSYAQSQANGSSILSSIQQFGRDATVTAGGRMAAGATPPLPATTFTTPSLQSGNVVGTKLVTSPGLTAISGAPPPGYGARFSALSIPYIPASYVNQAGDVVHRSYGYLIGDFDGDGRGDWLNWSVMNNSNDKLNLRALLSTKTGNSGMINSNSSLNISGFTPGYGGACDVKVWVADLDGDGRDDLLVQRGGRTAQAGLGKLIKLISNGHGKFSNGSVAQKWEYESDDCVINDFDGDGRDDIACTAAAAGQPTNGRVQLHFARSRPGAGWDLSDDLLANVNVESNFLPPSARKLQPGHLLTGGDFNADGLADVTIATKTPSGTWMLLAGTSKGDGTFTWSSQSTSWGYFPAHIQTRDEHDTLTTGDFDGDGKSDVMLLRAFSGALASTPDEAYIGLAGKGATQGAGRFRLSQVASAPWLKKISTGDFNGDGKTDLLCEENQVWARGKGDGQFDPPATGVTAIPGCGAAAAPDVSVGAADLNGDGRSDILCSHNDIANDAYILSDRMTGAGALNDDAQRWMHADMTGDGVADLVFVEHLNPGYRISLVSTNHTTLIQARTNFDVLPTATVPGLDEADTNRFMAFDAGSPTGGPDGKADLILVDRKDATSLQVYTLFSNGDGTFTPKIDVATFGARDLQNWRPADLDGDGNGDLIHLFSLGPGPGVKVSYLRSRGDGTWDSGGHHYFQQTAPLSRPSIQDFLNMEVNGDGRSDLVYLEPGAGSAGSIRTLLGKGDGTFSEKVFLSSAGFFRDMRRVKVADLNGDGLSDLVHVTAAAGRSNLLKLSIDAHLSDGCGGWKHRLLEVDPTTPSPNAEDRDLLEDINLVRFMDVDGDGRSDLIHLSTYLPTGGSPASALIVARNLAGGSSSWASDLAKGLAFGNYGFDPWRWQGYIDPQTRDSGLLYVHPVQSQAFLFRSPPDHITRTSNGIGGATEVTYTSLIGGRTYLPEGSLPQVVTSVETRDEAYNPAVTDVSRYAYDEARYSPALGRILGFGSLRKSDQRSAELTKTIMDDRCGARPSEFQKMDPTTNAMFSLTKLDYLNPTATQAAPYVCEQNLREDYEAEGTSNQRLARREELILDAYGNIISRVEKADQAVTTKILRPFNAPSTTGARAYIVNKPTAAGTQEYDGVNWTAKSFSTFEYDGNGVNVGPGALGELRAINAYYDSSHSVRTTYEYYPSGQLWRTTDPAGQRSTVVYDSTYGLYPETICSLPPARVSFGSLCQTHVVDPVTGQIKSTTDPNQAVTKFSYDAHGRLTRTTRDDQSFTATTYLDAGMLTGPPTARQRIRVEISDGSSDNVRWSEAFFDGLGRTYHAVREGGATQDTRFVDASRLPEAISDLYNAGGTPSEWTRYGYDPVGRTVRTLASDNSDQKSVFGVGQTIGIDQLGVRKIAYTNGRGQVIRIEEPKGVTAATAAITNYKHDGLGRLVEILDHFGNATSINYDMLGRQISTKDPDRGLTKFAYFDNGLLRERVDAKKQTIRFQYDPLGRSSQREDVEADGTTVSRTVTWTWDRTAARATMGASLGRMVAMQDQQSNAQLTASYHYDKLGRIDEAQRCVDGTCVSMGSTYDLAGRLKSLIYPDSTGSVVGTGAETVDYTYDDAGRLSKVGTYFAAQSYNLYDQLTDVTYGNGISTAIKYDPKRLWIDRAEVMSPLGSGPGTPLPIPIYLATYRHDATGRIQELQWDFQPAPPRGRGPTQPTASAVNLKYQYDDLGRLIKVDSPDAAHREDYHYDEIGRMKYNSRVGDIHYGDSLHVHAPTTSDLPPGSHIRKYDILGDLSELQDPTKALKLGWTIDGRVAVIYNINPGTGATTRTSFAYDPAGARVKKVSPTGGSMYFGPLIERQGSRLITYYMAGDRLIARRDGAAVSYYTQDHAHSTRLETDAGGQVVNRYDYSAFGLPLARQEQVPQDLEFAGGRSDDETGLTFMNARYYDPELRHFVSADTIVPRPMNPQSLHRYSFAQQDPINFWDPSGHMRLSVELRKDSYQQARTAWAGYSSQCSLGTGAAALVCAVPTGSWGAVIASGSPVKVNAMGEVVKIRGGGVWINVPLPPWSIMQTRRPAPQNTGAPLSPPPLVTVEDAEIAAFLKRQKDALAMLEDFDLELSVWDLVEKGKEYVDRVKKWKEWFTDVRDVNDALKDPDPVRGFDILDKTTKHLPDWWPFKEIWRRGPDTVRTAPGGVEAHERQRETGTISVHGGRLEEAFRGERE